MVDRPLKERAGARILVRAGERILLVQRHDPGIAGSSWWTLPGGGIDVGETSREAAARELLEETGIIVAPSDLRGPVATRTVTHGYSDRILRQVEEFFVAEIASPQKVRPLMWTPREEETMGEARWMTLDDVDALTDPVWEEPRRLLAALASENQPLKMAPVELSTVPVGA